MTSKGNLKSFAVDPGRGAAVSAEIQDAVTLCQSLSRMELQLTVHITRVAADEAFREFDRLRRVGTSDEYEAAQRVLDDVRARLADLERQVGG